MENTLDLSNPIRETVAYVLVPISQFVPQTGGGLYGVVNKVTKVVEYSDSQLPAALEALDALTSSVQKYETENFVVLTEPPF